MRYSWALTSIAYRFLDMVLCQGKLPQREKYVAEVCIGMFGSNIVVAIPDQDIPVYLDGPVVVTRFNVAPGFVHPFIGVTIVLSSRLKGTWLKCIM